MKGDLHQREWQPISIEPPKDADVIYGWFFRWGADSYSWEIADDWTESATHWVVLPPHPPRPF